MYLKMIKKIAILLTLLCTIGTFCAEDNLPEKITQSYWQCNWEKYDDAMRKSLVQQLSNYVADSLNVCVPEIRYFRDIEEERAYYDYGTNQIYINENIMFSSQLTFKSLCHELRHVWQYSRAMNPKSAEDLLYKQNFSNYISSDEQNYSLYSSQYIEKDAEMYANSIYSQYVSSTTQF